MVPNPSLTRRGFASVAAAVTATTLAGCLDAGDDTTEDADDGGTDGRNDTMNDTPDRRALHDPLPGLVAADDADAYADEHGLTVRNGTVEVVIELEPDGELPDDLVESVETEYAGRANAFVRIDRLEELAAHEDVRAVRPPAAAEPQ